jgi:transposase-like protein
VPLTHSGTRDLLIVCCDGLTGFIDAVKATRPEAVVQTPQ